MSKQVITIQCIPGAIIYAISAYHYLSCEFEPRSWRDVLDTTLCDKVCQWLATGWWFSPVSSTNKTERQNITEILLKMALNTINQTMYPPLDFKLLIYQQTYAWFSIK